MNWEYAILRLDAHGIIDPKFQLDGLEGGVNAQGRQGWELVNLMDVNLGTAGRSSILLAVFKRRKG